MVLELVYSRVNLQSLRPVRRRFYLLVRQHAVVIIGAFVNEFALFHLASELACVGLGLRHNHRIFRPETYSALRVAVIYNELGFAHTLQRQVADAGLLDYHMNAHVRLLWAELILRGLVLGLGSLKERRGLDAFNYSL